MSEAQKPTNADIADLLVQIADLLETQSTNPFRVRAYRDGADSIRSSNQSVANLVEQGKREALMDIPNIGEGLANVIFDYVETGRSDVRERLQADIHPAQVIAQVPGIGDELAQRIVDELDIHSLEDLEQAAHDGRLDKVEGFGPRRVEMVRTSLAGMLSGAARRHARRVESDRQRPSKPPVELLLDVDAEYRHKAEAGDLPTIAPNRFNPDKEAWLPILRSQRGDWKFTALYSNTAQAHKLNTTHDWVVIYFNQGEGEDQSTVVTEHDGPLAGRRVVRGRERETRQYYEEQD